MNERTPAAPSPRRVDTALSIAAVVIVVAVLVGTLVVWATAPDGRAEFDVEVEAVEDRLEVTVSNTGGEVATAVVVRATYPDGTEAEQTLDWLSPGESNEVVYVIGSSVTADELDGIEVRVVSYAPND